MDDIGETRELQKEQSLKQSSEVRSESWQKTIDQAEALAEEHSENGWEAASVAAFHTDPVSPSMGDDDDRFGLVHVIPDNHADRVASLLEANDFTEYQVYGRSISTFRFQVTELLDPERESALLIAAAYELPRANGLFTAMQERELMYTHAKTIDGTPLGVIKHEEYEPFLPAEAR